MPRSLWAGTPGAVVAVPAGGAGGLELVSANGGDNTLTVLTNALLVVTHSVPAVVVSWPSPSVDWQLQQAAALGVTNWSTNSLPIVDNGTNRSVTIVPPAGNLFFRLYLQP